MRCRLHRWLVDRGRGRDLAIAVRGPPGEMHTTVSLKAASWGTELGVGQEGVPDAIPPETRCLCRQGSRVLLAKFGEAEIPGQARSVGRMTRSKPRG